MASQSTSLSVHSVRATVQYVDSDAINVPLLLKQLAVSEEVILRDLT